MTSQMAQTSQQPVICRREYLKMLIETAEQGGANERYKGALTSNDNSPRDEDEL